MPNPSPMTMDPTKPVYGIPTPDVSRAASGVSSVVDSMGQAKMQQNQMATQAKLQQNAQMVDTINQQGQTIEGAVIHKNQQNRQNAYDSAEWQKRFQAYRDAQVQDQQWAAQRQERSMMAQQRAGQYSDAMNDVFGYPKDLFNLYSTSAMGKDVNAITAGKLLEHEQLMNSDPSYNLLRDGIKSASGLGTLNSWQQSIAQDRQSLATNPFAYDAKNTASDPKGIVLGALNQSIGGSGGSGAAPWGQGTPMAAGLPGISAMLAQAGNTGGAEALNRVIQNFDKDTPSDPQSNTSPSWMSYHAVNWLHDLKDQLDTAKNVDGVAPADRDGMNRASQSIDQITKNYLQTQGNQITPKLAAIKGDDLGMVAGLAHPETMKDSIKYWTGQSNDAYDKMLTFPIQDLRNAKLEAQPKLQRLAREAFKASLRGDDDMADALEDKFNSVIRETSAKGGNLVQGWLGGPNSVAPQKGVPPLLAAPQQSDVPMTTGAAAPGSPAPSAGDFGASGDSDYDTLMQKARDADKTSVVGAPASGGCASGHCGMSTGKLPRPSLLGGLKIRKK